MGDRIEVVVADHPVVRDGVVRLLQRRDCITVVDEAADGPEALAPIRARAPRFAVLDYPMPGLDGVAVAEANWAAGAEHRGRAVCRGRCGA